jgi:hypothetical protein
MYQLLGLFVTLVFAFMGGLLGGEWSSLGVGDWHLLQGREKTEEGGSLEERPLDPVSLTLIHPLTDIYLAPNLCQMRG